MSKIQNIAILAHVDAGKTSITEHLLYLGGNVRTKGNVDKGTSHTDFLEIERERGISVRAAGVSFQYKNTQINLIDTPGHADFSSEVERSLLAVDAAILVISAVESVQSHTETIWDKLSELNIPTLIFINKIDRAGADSGFVVEEIKKNLSKNIILLQEIKNEAHSNVNLELEWTSELSSNETLFANIVETVAEKEEAILEKYLEEEEISFQEIEHKLIELSQKGELYPVLFGSAKNNVGIESLIEFVLKYLPSAKQNIEKELSGIIYKIEHDKTLGKLAHIRLFEGEIENRQAVLNFSQNITEKTAQLKKIFTRKYEDIKKLSSGDVAIIAGFANAKAGDIIGRETENVKNPIPESPLLSVKVMPESDSDFSSLLSAFLQLSDEDPKLNLQWLSEQRELQISIQGKIQIEILNSILDERFGLQAKFEKPTIIYKETPKRVGEGYVKYWMPKPCWAIMRFKIEPLAQGAGVEYSSIVGVNEIKQRYQNQVERAISKSLKQGIKGWEVTDLKITLIEGEDHEVHTHPPDFTIATPMGIMDGLVNTGTDFLEPILEFKITAPEETLGIIASDLTKMRAKFVNPIFENERFTLTGEIPAASSLDYASVLASKTSGKGKIRMKYLAYKKCPKGEGEITKYRGISPLDRAKYILHVRNAL